MDWQYWNVAPGVECFFRPTGDETFEVIVLVNIVFYVHAT